MGLDRQAWRMEHRFDVLLKDPTAWGRVQQARREAANRLSWQRFFRRGFPMAVTVAGVALDVSTHQPRVRTDRHVTETRSTAYARPVGEVLVAVMCSLARNGYPIIRVKQGDDGCMLEARLLWSMRTGQGTIRCDVAPDAQQTSLEIELWVTGQRTDRGRFKRVFATLFTEVGQDLDAPIG